MSYKPILLIFIYSCFLSCSEKKKEKVTEATFKNDTINKTANNQDSIQKTIHKDSTLNKATPIKDTVLPQHAPAKISVHKNVKQQHKIETYLTPEIEATNIDSIKKIRLPKRLTNLDIPPHGNLNTRQWLILFYNTFKDGDYITGNEMALYYHSVTHLNYMSKSGIINFLEHHIDRITKSENQLIFSTIPKDGVQNSIHVPLLMDLRYQIENGASISFQDTFISKEGEFNGWPMLPVMLTGVMVIQKKDTIPDHGYINNNAYFIDYPHSKLNYKIHK